MEIIIKKENSFISDLTRRKIVLADLIVRMEQKLPFEIHDESGKDITQMELATVFSRDCFSAIASVSREALEELILTVLRPEFGVKTELPAITARSVAPISVPENRTLQSPTVSQNANSWTIGMYKNLKKRSRLSFELLASILGVTPPTLYRWNKLPKSHVLYPKYWGGLSALQVKLDKVKGSECPETYDSVASDLGIGRETMTAQSHWKVMVELRRRKQAWVNNMFKDLVVAK